MTTTLFLRDPVTTIPGVGDPNGYLGVWNGPNNGGGKGAGSMQLLSGSGALQSSESVSLTAQPSGNVAAIQQFLSGPLKAGTISAANWTIAFGMQSSITNWGAFCIITLVNGLTGLTRTTIFSGSIGATGRTTVGSEVTAFTSTAAGASATITAGDFLSVEIGVFQSSGANQTFVGTAFQNGTTAIVSDNVATSSAQAFITCPTTLTFATIQTFSFRAILATVTPSVDSAFFQNVSAQFTHANARLLDIAGGLSATTLAISSGLAGAASSKYLFYQFVSQYITGGGIDAGILVLRTAESNPSAPQLYVMMGKLYTINNAGNAAVNGVSTGVPNLSVFKTNTAEIAGVMTDTTVIVTPSIGQLLAFDLGMQNENATAATYQPTLFTDGSTGGSPKIDSAAAGVTIQCQIEIPVTATITVQATNPLGGYGEASPDARYFLGLNQPITPLRGAA